MSVLRIAETSSSSADTSGSARNPVTKVTTTGLGDVQSSSTWTRTVTTVNTALDMTVSTPTAVELSANDTHTTAPVTIFATTTQTTVVTAAPPAHNDQSMFFALALAGFVLAAVLLLLVITLLHVILRMRRRPTYTAAHHSFTPCTAAAMTVSRFVETDSQQESPEIARFSIYSIQGLTIGGEATSASRPPPTALTIGESSLHISVSPHSASCISSPTNDSETFSYRAFPTRRQEGRGASMGSTLPPPYDDDNPEMDSEETDADSSEATPPQPPSAGTEASVKG
ncbi:hypothetical protein C2E23DRAFT_888426 [Lenzites betulinus]|nr:hypothetical protein C2E23DRAFT_888426 [Lenzites betulinus]